MEITDFMGLLLPKSFTTDRLAKIYFCFYFIIFLWQNKDHSLSEATDGKFILPTEAYRGEGLSYYFAEPQDYIKIKNTDKLAEFFKERKLPYVQGRVWTTDSMLRETVNLVRKRKEEGCIAVEMELAGVQAICDFYGFELYDFLIAGDVLIEGNYETDGLSAANHDLDKLFLALQIAKSV